MQFEQRGGEDICKNAYLLLLQYIVIIIQAVLSETFVISFLTGYGLCMDILY